MGTSDVFARNIYIRLADDGAGFHYAIKYGGVTVKQGFVPASREYGTPTRGPLFVTRSDEENAEHDVDESV